MDTDVNLYEEIVKLNMRISCLEALLYEVMDMNPRLNLPTEDEMNEINDRVIQQVIDDLENED
jgi:hypothetical protein